MSAIVVSSVSPERWLMTAVYLFSFASWIASSSSPVSVPIWFTLMTSASRAETRAPPPARGPASRRGPAPVGRLPDPERETLFRRGGGRERQAPTGRDRLAGEHRPLSKNGSVVVPLAVGPLDERQAIDEAPRPVLAILEGLHDRMAGMRGSASWRAGWGWSRSSSSRRT